MTAETNKRQTFLESVKTVAIALVGAGIAGKGLTYFTPQISYDVPRILLPVYKAFGSTGLAVSMVVLGVLLAIWSFFRWVNDKRKPSQWLIIIGVLTLLIAGVVYMAGRPKTKEVSSVNSSQHRANDAVMAGADIVLPSLFSTESRQEYEQLVKNLETAIQEKDKSKSWTAYNKLNIFTAGLKPDQNNPEQLQFIIAQSQRMDDFNNQIKNFAGGQ